MSGTAIWAVGSSCWSVRLEAGRVDWNRVFLAGAPIDCLDLEGVIELIDESIASRTPLRHVAINAAKVVRMQRDPELRGAVQESRLATADGQAVAWAARVLGFGAVERITGIDLMHSLAAHAEKKGYRIYLFGGRESVLEQVVGRLRAEFPGLVIAGFQHGYYDRATEAEVVERIAGSGADILFVALSTPEKELFLARNHEYLQVPFRMGVGGAFDVFAGLAWNTVFIGLVCRELLRRSWR